MPVSDISFANGIFFARETGKISKADAEVWTAALHDCAKSSPVPVVAFIDARDMTLIAPDASKVFSKAAETPNVRVAVVVTSRPLATVMSQTVAILSRVGTTHETHIYNSYEEADRFAKAQAAAARA